MAESGKFIEVRIKKEVTVTNDAATASAEAATTPTQPAQNMENIAKTAKGRKSLAATVAVQYGKQIAQAAVSNYGELTGDYATQRSINTATEIGGMVATVAANPIVGGIGVGVSAATQIASYFIERGKHDRQVAVLRERTQTTIR